MKFPQVGLSPYTAYCLAFIFPGEIRPRSRAELSGSEKVSPVQSK